MNEEDIVVRENTALEQFMAALRQIMLAVGGWAVGRGYLAGDTLVALGTVVALIGPFLWGQLKMRKVLAERNSLVETSDKASFK